MPFTIATDSSKSINFIFFFDLFWFIYFIICFVVYLFLYFSIERNHFWKYNPFDIYWWLAMVHQKFRNFQLSWKFMIIKPFKCTDSHHSRTSHLFIILFFLFSFKISYNWRSCCRFYLRREINFISTMKWVIPFHLKSGKNNFKNQETKYKEEETNSFLKEGTKPK